MPDVLLKPVSNREAANFIADKPVVSRQVFDRLLPDLKARAMVITGVEDANLVQAVRTRLADLPQGGNWDEIKIEIAKEISPWLRDADATGKADVVEQTSSRAERRAELLLRTHGYQSYAVAAEEVGARQRAAFPFCQYVSMDDDDVRDTHAALDGIILPADSPFWETHTGPWEWGCRCQKIWLTQDDVDEIAQAEASNPPEARRVISGDRLRQLETQNRLITVGQGNAPMVVSTQPSGSFSFNPKTVRMDAAALRPRYDAETWKTFESWAQAQTLSGVPGSRTVWQWLNNQPGGSGPAPAAPQPAPVRPAPTPAAPDPVVVPSPTAPEPAVQARSAPVGAAIDIRISGNSKRQIREAIAAIDRVHGDGDLPTIPLLGKVGSKTARGSYWHTTGGSATNIGVKNTGPWPAMTAVHEVGHFIDHQVLGRRGSFASISSPELAAFRSAVQSSKAVAEIRRQPTYMQAYYLKEVELWARAYAQYIAVRSGNANLRAQLDKIRSTPESWTQWSDDDFAPIASAIDDVFKAKGWL